MKVLIQRVKEANVKINNELFSSIKQGILAFVGIEKGDSEENADKLVNKIVNLRIFPDDNDKMNYSLINIKGEMLIVSQFTLCGSCKKGTRPSFDNSAPPVEAKRLYEYFISQVKKHNIKTSTGKFGAMMEITLVNDGPVTFMLEDHTLM